MRQLGPPPAHPQPRRAARGLGAPHPSTRAASPNARRPLVRIAARPHPRIHRCADPPLHGFTDPRILRPSYEPTRHQRPSHIPRDRSTPVAPASRGTSASGHHFVCSRQTSQRAPPAPTLNARPGRWPQRTPRRWPPRAPSPAPNTRAPHSTFTDRIARAIAPASSHRSAGSASMARAMMAFHSSGTSPNGWLRPVNVSHMTAPAA